MHESMCAHIDMVSSSSVKLDSGGGSSRTIVRRVDGVLAVAGSLFLAALLVEHSVVVVVPDLETQASGVNVPVAPEEESTEAGLGEEVEDTVEDGLAVRGNNVTALAQTPGNWVEDPEESSQASAHEEGPFDISAKGLGVETSLPGEHVDNVEESNAAKDEVWPLVDALDKSTHQTSDNHNFVDKNNPEDGRPWHTSSEQQVHEQQRRGDEPVNVSSIEDGAVSATNDWVIAVEFDLNRGEAEVRAHGEVGNSSNKDNTRRDVVEETVAALYLERHADKDEACEAHNSADGKIEVGAMGCDVDVSGTAIDSVVVVLEHIVSAF